ncbi:gamma-glutamylcyclotransferase [Aureimonas endophytica]|uniref:Gamma-glutamylcyclotransferase n=1 Tax=Aureimonas endophytica TaxID=2027858 RepID=A0A916ZW07_9HYPH|nr:gamma-glutamylcyclotransferase family protein [Aureimonas endophytica]GGE15451.1 gamma-glutamylcyclotransferase [Aureimonas endophytica]
MFYFAYGSNLCRRHFSALCPAAGLVGPARLVGYRLVFRGFADIEPAPGECVPGGLWRVTPACRAALDRYEEVERGLYRPVDVDVELVPREEGEGRSPIAAFSYRMLEEGYRPPVPAYLSVIAGGYRDFGWDETLLDRAGLAKHRD